MRGSGIASASSGPYTAGRGSYSTRIAAAASHAASSSTAATAATGSPTKRTRSRARACSSSLTGRIPKGVGSSRPRRIAFTPGTFSAAETSIETILPCARGERWSLAISIRGRTRSSANFVAPAHFERPSTLRGERPICWNARLPAIPVLPGREDHHRAVLLEGLALEAAEELHAAEARLGEERLEVVPRRPARDRLPDVDGSSASRRVDLLDLHPGALDPRRPVERAVVPEPEPRSRAGVGDLVLEDPVPLRLGEELRPGGEGVEGEGSSRPEVFPA